MYEDTPPFEPTAKKKGLSTGAKIGIGCGAAALLTVLACAGLIYFGIRYVMDEADSFAREFEARGYSRVTGQVITVTQPVNQATTYVGQIVTFRAPVDTHVAVAAQTADVFSTINGDLDFYGQVLTIHPGAVITGDVRIKFAQAVSVAGTVEGEITGSFQTIDRRDKARIAPPPEERTEPEEDSESPEESEAPSDS